jgi:isocitrate dehydrogenase (NAD+)
MRIIDYNNIEDAINQAKEHFGNLVRKEYERINKIKNDNEFIDYSNISLIIIGVIGGDGIGPYITKEAQRILEHVLINEIKQGKVKFNYIDGLTIERRIQVLKPIPDDVLEQIVKCHVLLKGPTTTPKAGDNMPNIESANVAIRKLLDLFANVRPVRVPILNINWTFFRENTEDLYALGPYGIEIKNEFGIDFRLISYFGTYRIVKLAFEYAKKNGFKKVTAVNKSNVIKTTDGIFLKVFYEVSKKYPEIVADDWFIDIMTAKLIDEKRRSEFQVFVLPNLFGDILTDEAAEIQGGVGTAGSANIGTKYAMFEAIHGSAPRMVEEGRHIYADPSSVIKAGAMLLEHIGYKDKAQKINMALEIAGQYERKLVITGRSNGATTKEFADYILDLINDSKLEEKYRKFVESKV